MASRMKEMARVRTASLSIAMLLIFILTPGACSFLLNVNLNKVPLRSERTKVLSSMPQSGIDEKSTYVQYGRRFNYRVSHTSFLSCFGNCEQVAADVRNDNENLNHANVNMNANAAAASYAYHRQGSSNLENEDRDGSIQDEAKRCVLCLSLRPVL